MRWDALFSDYEAQMSAAGDDNWRGEVADRTRGERAAVELAARLSGARDQVLSVSLADGQTVTGYLRDCGSSWVLLEDDLLRSHLVPVSAITTVRGAGAIAHHLSRVEQRLDLTHTLRALSRDRVRVRVRTVGGEVVGVIAGVQADHIDVTEHTGQRASVPLAQIIEVVAG